MTEELDPDIEAILNEDEREYITDENENNKGDERTMRCAEITAAGKPLKISCKPLPQVPEEGALIKTLYGGICHSDIHFKDDETDLGDGKVFKHGDILGEKFTGLVLGHEICGIVEEVGKQVSSSHPIKVGDTVVVYPFQGCRQCEACSEGQSQQCENNQSGTTDIGQGGAPGGYGGYVPVSEISFCIKLPKNVKPEIGCLLPCSAVTAFSALQKARPTLEAAIRLRGVANLLVIGVGGLGMWTVVIVKHLFCDKNVKIICADLKKDKLDSAADLGADDVIQWSTESDIDNLVSATTVNGYNKIDVAINYVGSQKTMEVAFESLHHGGSIVAVGLYGGSYNLSLPILTSKSVSILGLRATSLGALRQLVDLLAVQNIETYPPVEIVTLDQVNDAMDRLRKGEVLGRAIIKHTE